MAPRTLAAASLAVLAATTLASTPEDRVSGPAAPAQPAGLVGATPRGDATGWKRFEGRHPGVRRLDRFDRPQRLYGVPMGGGVDPVAAATAFMTSTVQDVWGIAPAAFLPLGPFADESHVVPLVTDPVTGRAAFTLVAWTPHVDGVPVFDASLRVLVRNEPGHPVVLASAQLPDVGDFRVPGGLVPADLRANRFAAIAREEAPMDATVTGIRPVVFAGVEGRSVAPRVAVDFVLEGRFADGTRYRHRFVADPVDGEILHDENQVLHADVELTVLTTVPDGIGAASAHAHLRAAAPRSRLGGWRRVPRRRPRPRGGLQSGQRGGRGGGHARDPMVLDQRRLRDGHRLGDRVVRVRHHGFDHPGHVRGVELVQAQTTATYHAEVVRNFTLSRSGNYPVIANQQNFQCNVNHNSTCNAYYDGNSINFYASGEGCWNTAFDTVVHHEYGHHLVNVAGSGQGAYGEGAGDTMGMLITGDSRLGVGFYANNCGNGIRNANNSCQYSAGGCSTCGSAIHSCGQLLSGMVWDIRDGFIAAGLGTERVESIFINSMPLHDGTAIDQSVVIDWLTLDDDDGSILNGTPHYGIIDEGVRQHGLAAPRFWWGPSPSSATRPRRSPPRGRPPSRCG